MVDHMHIDIAGFTDDGRADPRAGKRRGDASAAAGAENELSGVDGAGELHQRGGDVLADDLVVGAIEFLYERALFGKCRGVPGAESVLAGDVHGDQFSAGGAGRDARATSQQRLTFRAAGEGDDDAFAGFPGAVYAVVFTISLQRLVDFVREPDQREFA